MKRFRMQHFFMACTKCKTKIYITNIFKTELLAFYVLMDSTGLKLGGDLGEM